MLTELGKELNEAGFAAVCEAHSEEMPATLGFKKNSKLKRYKVVRIDTANKKIWAEPVKLYKPDEINIVDKKKGKK